MKKYISKKVEYEKFIKEMKFKIQSAQIKVAISVNRELLEFIKQWYKYWSKDSNITKQIVSQIFQISWGHNIATMSKIKDLDVQDK